MPKFVALITGSGEGCDYTIGCNIKWEMGDADNREEFVKNILKDWGMTNFDGDYLMDIPIEKMEVYEVKDDVLKLDSLDTWYHEEHKKHKKKKEEEQDREEYERLKAKYEK